MCNNEKNDLPLGHEQVKSYNPVREHLPPFSQGEGRHG